MSTALPTKHRAPVRSEKAEERLCDDLVARIAGREAVVRFSQARATNQTPGIPDRRYRLFGVALWFEIKAENGKLSAAQRDYLRAELACGSAAACGTLEDLSALLPVLREDRVAIVPGAELLDACTTLVDRWVARGLRAGDR